MPKKTPRKSNYQLNSPFIKTSTKKGRQAFVKSSQQKTLTPKKAQNNNPKLTISKNTFSDKISNNINSLFEDKVTSSNSSDSENEESDEQEFNKDEPGGEDEDIVMQDVKSSTTSEEEEDNTDSSDDENTEKINYSEEESREESKEESEEGSEEELEEESEESEEESEEENLNEENLDKKESDDEMDDEIVEHTTKISLKKKAKEKEKIKSQDKTTSKETAETKDPIPIPLLARPEAEKQFRDYYMNQITKAFGEDLDKLRKKEANLSSNKLEILIDSLESGISIFSNVEKELALLSSNKK